MSPLLEAALQALPNPVPWAGVVECDSFDERRALVEPRTANIVGVLTDGVEFCPNDDPPSAAESLAFLWLVRPDLSTAILAEINEPSVAEVIAEFMSGAGPSI